MRRFSFVLALLAAFVLGAGVTWWLARNTPPVVPSSGSPPADQATGPTDREVLYWYDPMVPQSRFDNPGKSPFMDMMLVPKYASEAQDQGTVAIEPRLVQNLGVRTGTAVLGQLESEVRAVGSVAFDERAVSVVQARVAAIVEQLHVRAPMDPVRAGQPLFTLIAPDWTAAQEEFLALRRSTARGLDSLQQAARARLLLLGMGEAQVRALERSGRPNARITIVAPRSGVLAELAVREGASVMAGSPLARINGLDTVWVNTAVPEREAGSIRAGSQATATVAAQPGRTFAGTVEALLPSVDPATRTLIARVVLDNADGALIPGMYAQLALRPENRGARCVLVPTEALIATGTRQVVIVALGDGRFRPQTVEVGIEAQGQSEILAGLDEGDQVVLSGQFLIDSEASLSGALAAMKPVAAEPPADGDGKSTPVAERHTADGVLERIQGDRWTIDTGPIASLDMGAMTMQFRRPDNPSTTPKAGQRFQFTFFQNAEGDYQIDTVTVSDLDPKAGARP